MNDAENLKIYKQYIEEGLKKASSNNPFDVINAVDIIKKAVDLKPEEIEGWMCLGELYESLGNNPPGILARIDQYKKAFDSFKKVIELDNKNIEAWFRAGLNSEKMGDLVLEEKQKYEY
jgi:tetratricopeptide (TPR) repeat protein